MRIILLGLGLLAVATVAIFLLLRKRNEASGPFGFREVLKDGRKRALLAEQMNPQNLDKLTDSEVRDLVEAYVKTQHQSPEYWAVRELKERAAPFLVEVLKRPESFVKPEPKGILDESPAERALAMLTPFPPDSVVPLLLPFVESTNQWQRLEAARHLSLTGKESVKDAVCRLLGDPDDYVRAAAADGLLSVASTDRAEPALLAAAFEPLKELTTRPDKAMCAARAAELLLHIDRPRAVDFLTRDSVVNASNPNVDRLLAQLTSEGIAAPPDLLLRLIHTTTNAPAGPATSFVLGEAIKNLAVQKHPAAEGLIRSALSEPPAAGEAELPSYLRPRLARRKLAAQALCILNDLSDPLHTAFANEDKVGFGQLPLAQQRLVLAVHLEGQVSNGGFSQYFFNSSDDPGAVAAALDDIGEPECARIIRDAAAVFGKAGPSRDTETRRQQLEKLSTDQDAVLASADDRWFAQHADLDTSLYLYALKHKAEFSAAAKR